MLTTLLLCAALASSDDPRTRIEPVPFTAVQITDGFWAPRQETSRTVTIPACFKQCEESGRIANFDRAAGKDPSPHQGNCYDDSDVYKVIEGAAYSLASHPDPALDAYLDQLIARIAAAQEPDGYLYTIATANKRPLDARWAQEQWSHETYCAGHLLEAAIAHHQATGKRELLDVATKFADLLVRVFSPTAASNARPEVPGHQEVELGLVRLHRLTGKSEYLDLARHFLVARGNAKDRALYGEYAQDHLPLLDQRTAVGHSVRAAYLYTSMADLEAITGETTFDTALDAIWWDCVGTKMHITGGIGAHAHNEGFGAAYELPNESAYLETCAAIANCMWNHRMFLRSGSSVPIDVLERTLYNGMLSGVSLAGDTFFYPNPLACDGMRRFNQGTLGRARWFGCACCPVNVARFIPSIGGYIYATGERTIYANLFVQGDATITLDDTDVQITQTTEYPWDGRVAFAITPPRPMRFMLAVRIPGWVRGQPVPGDLYADLTATSGTWELSANGKPLAAPVKNGFAMIDRTWTQGDRVALTLPMPVRRVVTHANVTTNAGRVALERGPLVYAVESVDADGSVRDLFVSDTAAIRTAMSDEPTKGTVQLVVDGARVDADGASSATVRAIPYCLWANRPGPRGVGEMAVWLPRTSSLAEVKPPETTASRATVSASHTWSTDTELAVNDRRLPATSADVSIPRQTFWPRKGGTDVPPEWIEYTWPAPIAISGSTVYFFDDTGVGGRCALPSALRLLARIDGIWVPVDATCTIARDRACAMTFRPITTDALRLELTLADDHSAGVLEWTAEEPRPLLPHAELSEDATEDVIRGDRSADRAECVERGTQRRRHKFRLTQRARRHERMCLFQAGKRGAQRGLMTSGNDERFSFGRGNAGFQPLRDRTAQRVQPGSGARTYRESYLRLHKITLGTHQQFVAFRIRALVRRRAAKNDFGAIDRGAGLSFHLRRHVPSVEISFLDARHIEQPHAMQAAR
ncbi:MAG: glycoside hydrolase family 127 protein [Phycisphaerae bacterium]|nr:glycoside hydrolase family 127 protein [Phycisphaerae bacterium]